MRPKKQETLRWFVDPCLHLLGSVGHLRRCALLFMDAHCAAPAARRCAWLRVAPRRSALLRVAPWRLGQPRVAPRRFARFALLHVSPRGSASLSASIRVSPRGCSSLLVPARRCTSLRVAARCCASLRVAGGRCASLGIAARCWGSLRVAARRCAFAARRCSLLFVAPARRSATSSKLRNK